MVVAVVVDKKVNAAVDTAVVADRPEHSGVDPEF